VKIAGLETEIVTAPEYILISAMKNTICTVALKGKNKGSLL
jgi:hypothetical protein